MTSQAKPPNNQDSALKVVNRRIDRYSPTLEKEIEQKLKNLKVQLELFNQEINNND